MPQEIKKDENNDDIIYDMLKQFRQWNAEWECFNRVKPLSSSEFVDKLSEQFDVKRKELPKAKFNIR